MRPGDEREDDEGGEAPCFAHLLDDGEPEVEGDDATDEDPPVPA